MKMFWVFVCAAIALGPADVQQPVGPPPMGPERFEALLPAGTVVYVSVRNVPAFLADIRQTPMYKVVSQKGFFDGFLPEATLGEIQGFWGKYVAPLGEIFGGEVALALTTFKGVGGMPSVVLLADVGGHEAALQKYLGENILPLLEGAAVEPEEMTVAGVTVTKIVSEEMFGPRVFFGVKNGVLAVSMEPNTLEAVFNALGGPSGETLEADKIFAEFRNALGEVDFFGYVNIEACLEKAWENAADWGGGDDFDRGRTTFSAIAGFTKVRAGGMGIALGPDGGTTTIRLSCEGPRGGVFGVLARPAPALKSVKYVPEDAGCFVGFSLGSLVQLYKDALGVLQAYDKATEWTEAEDDFRGAITLVEQELGLSIEKEILPAFGGEVAVAGWAPEALVMPPIVGLVEIKEGAVVKKLVAQFPDVLEKLMEVEVARKTVKHKEIEVTTITVAPEETLAVAVVGDFLIVGTSAAAVKKVIDTAAGGKSLAENADYRRYVESLPGNATITVYVALKHLFDFGRPLLAAQEPGDPAEPGSPASIVKALEALGECVSSFGLKVVGDEKGVTIVSSSRHGGLGPMIISVPGVGAGWFIVSMQAWRHRGAAEDFVIEEEFLDEEDMDEMEEDLEEVECE